MPVDPIQIEIAGLPDELEGFRILHLSDLHIRHPRPRHEQVLAAVARHEYDLLVITGDSMVNTPDEPAAHDWMVRLMRTARPKLGLAGVWGNHDSPLLRSRLAPLPIRWLNNTAWVMQELPLTILGVDCVKGEPHAPAGDLLGAVMDEAEHRYDERPRCRILLAHMPTWLIPAASFKIDLMLSGHTHGGQCRLPTGHILYNATPGWPLRYSSGLLQLGTTQCLISRGLGEMYIESLRLFCTPQLPLTTLRRAAKPLPPTDRIQRIRAG